ncbi:DUF421 domain-containing protein [Rossellomorea sp. BNER]|jgi:uncharacterized membrane protein YcaP (DUF421 family)|uniref:DUF421 domain-containing protein n=1 Tax=Rossellomorea sp. BNER TaxID=2962031 RepID=UPI003AF2DEAC|nr:DUF421 domain-containing protein [Rossellomorea sp. BNER]
MEEYLILIVRTLFLYFVITLIFRVMGKREIGELSVLDLVVNIMIAELAVLAIEEPRDAILHTLIPMLILLLVQLTTAFLSLKSKPFRELVDGKPTVIIHNGKIDEKAMKQQRYNFDDLLLQLREKDVMNMAEVEYAILEPSGSLSIVKKDDTNRSQSQEPLSLPLILDGKIQLDHLAGINQTDFWLRKELRKRGFTNLKEISFCSYHNGEFFIDQIDK